MLDVPTYVKRDLHNLVPVSLHEDIRCFAFHDHHPRDHRKIDVIICTVRREVMQLFQKDVISSSPLNTAAEPTSITNFRNNNCELFYLVKAGDELLILAGDLKCIQKLLDVERFEIGDWNFSGECSLKVWTTDDAVPTMFDNDFQMKSDSQIELSQNLVAPVEAKLDSMVVQARFNLAHNEKALQDLKILRQEAAFKYYESLHTNLCKGYKSQDINEIIAILKLKTQCQWIKICNKKIVIALSVSVEDDSHIEDVQVLLHTIENSTVTYTTKLYESIKDEPYWCDVSARNLTRDCTVVVVVALEELKYDELSRIQLNGVVSYTEDGMEKILPMETVTLSAKDTMGGDYDAFTNKIIDQHSLLAVLATSNAHDLYILNISQSLTQESLSSAFCIYLNMEAVGDSVVVHRKSPYHELYGVLIVFHESGTCGVAGVSKVTVYSRSDTQILCLVHCLYQMIPDRLVVLPPHSDCTSRDPSISKQLKTLNKPDAVNITPLVESLQAQMTALIHYYDMCMMRMNESTDEKVMNKIGVEIDIFACGKERFGELKEELRKSMARGMEAMPIKEALENSEYMTVDSEEF